MKYILLLLLILLIPFVYSTGISGQEYTYFKIEKCYGDVYTRVYEYNPEINYNLVNCVLTNNISEWTCPCTNELKILTQANTTSSYAILIQYNINKTIQPFNGSNLTEQDNIYNSQLKRIYTVTNITLTPYVSTALDEQTSNIMNTIFYIFIAFIVACLLGVVAWAVIYAMSDKIKRWIGMDKNEDLTFKTIMKNIFSRKNIIKKEIIIQEKKVQNKKPTNEEMAKLILDQVNK